MKPPPSEGRRQLVHLGCTLFILPLPWLETTGALVLAGAAALLNWVVFPVTGLDRRWFRREGESFVNGAKVYPVAVLVVVALFDLWVAAGAWAVMGVGDAASNLVGRRIGKPPFLGRPDRSAAGTVAFVLTAAPACLAAFFWVFPVPIPQSALPVLIAASFAAAAAGALMEYIPWPAPLEDNLPITLAAAVALYFAVPPM